MKIQSRLLSVLLILAALISLVIPFTVLFMGDGVFAWSVKQPESIRMLLEILLLILLMGAAFLFTKSGQVRLLAMALIFLIFCWLHVTFLPMLISGLYIGFLILTGRLLREKVLRISVSHRIFIDFLLGSSVVITEFCLLSLLQIGGIPVLRTVALIQGGLLYSWLFFSAGRSHGNMRNQIREFFLTEEQFYHKKTTGGRFLYATLVTVLFVSVLIQIGKMNISLDFDTLWYGVRSEYILDFGKGIYENPGMAGMVYVYSKGLEVLVLPLSNLASHSYLLFFNVWVAVLGLAAVYTAARFFMGRTCALLASALMSAVPGLMNMSISAKPDVITWLLQLIMIICLLSYLKRADVGKRPVRYLILAAGAYLLSLTMKTTSLVFSTAIFGMSGLYLIFSKKVSFRAPVRHWLALFPPVLALAGIWGRTWLITGMPVTSVFTSILEKLGFSLKYPFAVGALPQNWQEESNLVVLVRRLYQMLLSPEGKDMDHVIIAWGTSLIFFLLVCLFVFRLTETSRRREKTAYTVFTHVVFWPFLFVNMVSLIMLYQVDGNYFILLYTAVIVFACHMFEGLADSSVKQLGLVLLAPLLAFNILVSAESNWAWSLGFSEIKPVNAGYVNHRALQQEDMAEKGNTEIWNKLAEDSSNRVISFGTHPFCLEFPCNVQSYRDITSPWGNVELVNSVTAFEDYMTYADTDYVYVEAGFAGETNIWSWSYGILKQMIERGTLTELYFENGNVLAKVTKDRQHVGADGEQSSKQNLQLFMEQYEAAK